MNAYFITLSKFLKIKKKNGANQALQELSHLVCFCVRRARRFEQSEAIRLKEAKHVRAWSSTCLSFFITIFLLTYNKNFKIETIVYLKIYLPPWLSSYSGGFVKDL